MRQNDRSLSFSLSLVEQNLVDERRPSGGQDFNFSKNTFERVPAGKRGVESGTVTGNSGRVFSPRRLQSRVLLWGGWGIRETFFFGTMRVVIKLRCYFDFDYFCERMENVEHVQHEYVVQRRVNFSKRTREISFSDCLAVFLTFCVFLVFLTG